MRITAPQPPPPEGRMKTFWDWLTLPPPRGLGLWPRRKEPSDEKWNKRPPQPPLR